MAKHDLFHLGQVGLAGNIDHLSNFLEIPPPKQKALWLLAATYVRIGSKCDSGASSGYDGSDPNTGDLTDRITEGSKIAPDALDQTAGDDVVDEDQSFEDFNRCRMGGRGARIVVDPLLGLEDFDRKTLARQRQRRDDADRAAAGNEDGTLARHFPAFCAGRSVAAIRGGVIACWAICPVRSSNFAQTRPGRSLG